MPEATKRAVVSAHDCVHCAFHDFSPIDRIKLVQIIAEQAFQIFMVLKCRLEAALGRGWPRRIWRWYIKKPTRMGLCQGRGFRPV